MAQIIAVVNNDADTVALFDITDPTNIVAKDTQATSGLDPRCCFVLGNYVYVTTFTGLSLEIFDISDPDTIVVKDTITTGVGSAPLGVYVVGNYAYVCCSGTDTLAIFDISDPTNIVAKDTIVTNLNNPQNVVVVGNYAYVTNIDNDIFAVFDISDPTNIVAKDTYTTTATFANPIGLAVNAAGTYAFVVCNGSSATATDNGVLVIDISDPDNISLADSLQVEVPPLANQAFLRGNYLYVTGQSTGDASAMAVFDVTTPTAITAVGTDSTGLSTARGIYVYNNYAYVCSGANDTLVSFNVTTKKGIVQKDTDTTNLSGPNDVFLDDSYAYVTSSANDRICMYDITNLDAIVAKDFQSGTPFDIAEACWTIYPYIYVVNRGTTTRRLQIVDATDPTNLVNKDFDTTGFNAPSDVQVVSNYAYVLQTGTSTLYIYDVTDPTAIVAKDSDNTGLSLTSTLSGLYKLGNYVYVCSSANDTLAIFDVSTVTAIVPKDTITTNLDNPAKVIVDGNYAYVTSKDNARLCIYDISDATNIVAKGFTADRLVSPDDIAKKGNFIFIGDGDYVKVYDVTDVDAPVYQTSIGTTLDNVLGLFVNDNTMAVISSTDNALCLFDVSDIGGIIIADEITTNLNNPYWVHGDLVEPTPETAQLPQVMVI